MKWLLFILSTIVVIIFFIIAISYYTFNSRVNDTFNNSDYFKGNDNNIFVINKGDTNHEISQNLYTQKLINDPNIFELYIRYISKSEFKAGSYKVKLNTNYKGVIASLEEPVITQIKISFQEGLRLDEIVKKIDSQITNQVLASDKKFDLEELNKILNNPKENLKEYSKYDWLQSFLGNRNDLEGLLFPDTYFFTPKVTASEIIFKLLDNFYSKIITASTTNSSPIKYSNYEYLILASIVEKEGSGKLDDNSHIAGVFYNRLQGKLGHKRLQSDVVLLYEFKDWKHQITQKEIENANLKYNSHAKDGLPPTPICSVGFNSLKAVFNPMSTKDLFFIADSEGTIHYAETYAKHLENVNKYLR